MTTKNPPEPTPEEKPADQTAAIIIIVVIVVLVIAIGITITLIVLRKKKDKDGSGKGKGGKGKGKRGDSYREAQNTERATTQRTQPDQPQVQSTPSRREQQPVVEERQRETSLRTRNEVEQNRRQSEVRRQSEARPVIIEANQQVNIEEEGSVGADAPVVKQSEVAPTAGPGASQIRNQQRNNLANNRGGGASQVMNQAAPSGLMRKDQVDDDPQ